MPAPGSNVVLCIADREPRRCLVTLKDGASLRLAKGCTVSVAAAAEAPFGALFQAEPGRRQLVRLPDCQALYEEADAEEEDLNARDNSQLVEDGAAQALSEQDVRRLKESEAGPDLVQQLVTNSASFTGKTVLAQAKYIRKKRQKHCPFLTVQRPSPGLLVEAMKAKAAAILGMRQDTLAQMLAYANVHANARVLCVDGVKGLLTGSVLYRLGAEGAGHVVHLYPRSGDERGSSAGNLSSVERLNLEQLAATRVHCVPFDLLPAVQAACEGGEPPAVAPTPTQEAAGPQSSAEPTEEVIEGTAEGSPAGAPEGGRGKREGAAGRRRWTAACSVAEATAVLAGGADALLMAAWLHPLDTLARVWPFLEPAGTFSVFCPVLPPLQEVYDALRNGEHAVQLVLCDNWLREYQVLPNRTHPLVNMSGTGGYLLSGVKVEAVRPLAGRLPGGGRAGGPTPTATVAADAPPHADEAASKRARLG